MFGEALLCRLGAAWLAAARLFFQSALPYRTRCSPTVTTSANASCSPTIYCPNLRPRCRCQRHRLVSVGARGLMCFMKNDALRRKTANLRQQLLVLDKSFPSA